MEDIRPLALARRVVGEFKNDDDDNDDEVDDGDVEWPS